MTDQCWCWLVDYGDVVYVLEGDPSDFIDSDDCEVTIAWWDAKPFVDDTGGLDSSEGTALAMMERDDSAGLLVEYEDITVEEKREIAFEFDKDMFEGTIERYGEN